MADFHLARPAFGVSNNVSCEKGMRFVFEFPVSDTSMSRSGDDLVFRFSDGSAVILQGFYETYNSEELPTFAMEGQEIGAHDFFAAMNVPGLMPAEGASPSSSKSPKAKGHNGEYENMALLDGLDRLDGEDLGWKDGGFTEHKLDGWASRGMKSPWIPSKSRSRSLMTT